MALISTGNLDFSKTYVCNEISDSIIAKIIQNLSIQVYPSFKKENIASHTFALRFKNNEWHVYENHLKWGGIKEYPLSEYDYSNVKDIQVNEYPLNLISMDYWLEHSPGYSVCNLFEMAESRILKGLKLPDTKGWVCSETIAAMNFDICLTLNKPFSEIAPCDWQYYLSTKRGQNNGI